ncbi:hypothetical protein Tco_1391981 [Tanacetum coccineum]
MVNCCRGYGYRCNHNVNGKVKTSVSDASGPFTSSQKIREDHVTPIEASVCWNPGSAVHRFLLKVMHNAESFREREDEGHTDSVTGLNLRTIGAPQRFVISSDSSHHSGANISEAEVDSFARPSVPRKVVDPTIFSADSTSAGGTDPAMGGFTNPIGSDFLWNVTNGSRLDDGGVCREMVDEFAPPNFFASVRGMEHDQLFTEFNVGAARQMSLSAGVRMRAEYNIKERRRLKSIVKEGDILLKARDEEIGSLKAQLLLKEAEVAEAIRLRAVASKFKAVEKSLQGEVEVFKERNTTLEKEKNEMDVKVVDLAAFVKVRNNEFADDRGDDADASVHELEASSAILQEKVSVCENFSEQLEKFQDEQMKVLNVNKDSSVENFNEFHSQLQQTLAESLGLNESQPHVDQLMVPIHHSLDQTVVGATALSLSLEVSHARVQKIRENIANHRSALRDVFIPLDKPFSAVALEGTRGISDTVPATVEQQDTTLTITLLPPVHLFLFSIDDLRGSRAQKYKARVKSVFPRDSLAHSHEEATSAMVKAQGVWVFALNTLTQLAQAVTSKNDSLAIRVSVLLIQRLKYLMQ